MQRQITISFKCANLMTVELVVAKKNACKFDNINFPNIRLTTPSLKWGSLIL
jgi:hypothetical protein